MLSCETPALPRFFDKLLLGTVVQVWHFVMALEHMICVDVLNTHCVLGHVDLLAST